MDVIEMYFCQKSLHWKCYVLKRISVMQAPLSCQIATVSNPCLKTWYSIGCLF